VSSARARIERYLMSAHCDLGPVAGSMLTIMPMGVHRDLGPGGAPATRDHADDSTVRQIIKRPRKPDTRLPARKPMAG
jgi:hypothetical protein